MAKKSVNHRNEVRAKLVKRYKPQRDLLRKSVSDPNLSEKQRWEAMLQLQKLPRDSSPCRRRNRCQSEGCSRPRAFTRLTGLCRLHMRIAVLAGLVPGMQKSSW
ncbi:MAG TPA: 30S ribosomal protein S14 [Gammaproteobacteria bacterium]|jgi:small subunit ribosomal protein S14|nr:30S ribosomal protein S14 [Gammaproteobacteria bacterium]